MPNLGGLLDAIFISLNLLFRMRLRIFSSTRSRIIK